MESIYHAFEAARLTTPSHPFLAESSLSGGRVWSYEEVGEEVELLSLQYANAGWGFGHRVAVNVGNHPRHFFHFLALNKIGASIVPMNPDYRTAEINYILTHANVDLVVCQKEQMEITVYSLTSNENLNKLKIVDVENFSISMPESALIRTKGRIGPRTEAAILYTSGTSGQPKGCILNNEYALIAGAWYRDLGGLLSFKNGQDRLLNPLPVFHMNCSMVAFTAIILTNNCLVLPNRFHSSTWWEDCVKSRATAIHYLGIMPPALFKQAENEWEKRHDIRFGLGAGCDPTLHDGFEERFGFPLVEVWGMTETGRFISNHIDPRQTHTRAFGRALYPLEVRVVDENDNDVPINQAGELLLRAQGDDPRKGFFAGYLKNEEATAMTWRDGWFHSGDVICRDENGMLYFIDRKKDMIRRSGENISAAEVEATLAYHPLVQRVAVIAIPDQMRDEEVLAVIVPSPGAIPNKHTAIELVAYCLRELAYYKAPGWIIFRDSLPTTPTNKIQKNKILIGDEDPLRDAFDCRTMKKRTGK